MRLHTSLANKLYVLLGAALAVLGALILAAAWLYWSSTEDFQRQGHQRNQTSTLQLQTVNDFRAQVQQWKDLLLRGQDPVERARYWARFEALEQRTEQDAHALIERADSAEQRELLEQFLQAHQQAGLVYRAALKVYEAPDGNALRADMLARGVDRYPGSLLERDSDETARATRQSLQEAGEDARRRLLITLLAAAASAVLAIGTAIWMIRLWLVQPARLLVEQLDRLSAGDLSMRIESASQDELGAIAQRVDSIRRALGRIIEPGH